MTYGTHRSDNSFAHYPTFLHYHKHLANDNAQCWFVNRYVLVLSEQIIAHNFVVLQSWIELRSGSSARVANQASLERGLYLRYTDNTCLEHTRPKITVPAGKSFSDFI